MLSAMCVFDIASAVCFSTTIPMRGSIDATIHMKYGVARRVTSAGAPNTCRWGAKTISAATMTNPTITDTAVPARILRATPATSPAPQAIPAIGVIATMKPRWNSAATTHTLFARVAAARSTVPT